MHVARSTAALLRSARPNPLRSLSKCWRSCAMWSLKRPTISACRSRAILIFAPLWLATFKWGSLAWTRVTRVRSRRSRTTSKCSTSATWIPLWAISSASTRKGPLAGARSTSQMWWRSLWWSSARRCCLAARRFKPATAAWWRSCARMPIRPRCACACA